MALRVMVLPLPEQGHVTPLMELSHRLVDHGFEVTFVCTERTHALILGGLGHGTDGYEVPGGIHLVAIPDGLTNDDDRRDISKFLDGFSRSIPGHLEELIRTTKVKCLVADATVVGMCFEVAKKLAVRVACFSPMPAAYLGTLLRIPELITDGFFDENGFPKRRGEFLLAPNMPPLYTSHVPWVVAGGPEVQRIFFRNASRNAQATRVADMVLCNTFQDGEATAFELYPKLLPIGPLFAEGKMVGQFLPEDTTCLEWLDAQPDKSVLYAAFGSTTIFDPSQIRELAEGLELAGRPFLWVVRPDFSSGSGGMGKVWFDEFQKRTAGKGMVVSWCAQQQVLAHRAVGCFLSHCGWHSVLEAVRNGVPMVCWPYFFDHFTIRSYVCDIWRTGLALSPMEDGSVTKEEVSTKVERVITDHGIAERARILSDVACQSLAKGGSSYENFKTFVNFLKASL